MEVASDEERAQASEQYNDLLQQRIRLSATVEEFICKAAAELNDRVMQDLQKISPEIHNSKGPHSRSSSRSKTSSGSQTQAWRVEAVKARLALEFAKREKQRKIEVEMKMLELERKQGETARIRAIEEEELKSAIRLEAPKAEEESKLAEARKSDALMDLEGRLAEELEDFSDSDITSEPDPPGEAPRDPMGPTALSYDLLPPASRPEPKTDPPLLNQSATLSTIIYTAASVNPSMTGASLFTSTLPLYSVTPRFFATEAPSRVCDPVSSALLISTTYGQAPSMANAPWLQESFPIPSVKSRLPEPSSSPGHDNTLALVASAMKDVLKVQQRLAYNQDLLPIQIKKFFGALDEFPLFKQYFQHAVMSREDIDDENKMICLLQFLGGEAKETVCGLDTAVGGIYQAIKIL